jgi:hypothetical protein
MVFNGVLNIEGYMKTLLLNPSTWDLLLDSNGNIAVATNPYSISQDVASAIKVFLGELYYDNTKGLPYLDQILGQGKANAVAVVSAQTEQAALTVPEVVRAKCTQLYYSNRVLSGVVEVIDTTSAARNIQF